MHPLAFVSLGYRSDPGCLPWYCFAAPAPALLLFLLLLLLSADRARKCARSKDGGATRTHSQRAAGEAKRGDAGWVGAAVLLVPFSPPLLRGALKVEHSLYEFTHPSWRVSPLEIAERRSRSARLIQPAAHATVGACPPG